MIFNKLKNSLNKINYKVKEDNYKDIAIYLDSTPIPNPHEYILTIKFIILIKKN